MVHKTWPAKAQEVYSPTIIITANYNKHSDFRNISFCEEMRGRAVVLVLFCWAALTIITPILVRMSASAKVTSNLNGERSEKILAKIYTLLSRRALVRYHHIHQ